MRHVLIHPLTPLCLFSMADAVLITTYLAAGLTPSRTFEMLALIGWSILLALWVVVDARHRKCIPCFDFGFLSYIFLPIAVPWYCFWSRGWRGFRTLILLCGLWLMPYLVVMTVWFIHYR